MKKITFAIILAMFSYSSASAEIGVNVGLSGNAALFAATATELDVGTHGTTTGQDEKQSDTEILGLGYGSVFIEKTLGSMITLGVDYVFSPIETETSESIVMDLLGDGDGAATAKTNKVQVDFEGLTTFYVAVNVTENMYVKAGAMSVDIVTKESLDTGSTYGDTDTDGTMLGIGFSTTFDNGMFLRGESRVMEWNSAAVTSDTGANKITMDSLDGVSGVLSIGKSF